jgi:hypothetical protein
MNRMDAALSVAALVAFALRAPTQRAVGMSPDGSNLLIRGVHRRHRYRRCVLALALLGIFGCAPRPIWQRIAAIPSPRCGSEGQVCCVPPGAKAPTGMLAKCGTGLGCNIILNRCERPCGDVGQVCCDGPDTLSPTWTLDGHITSPFPTTPTGDKLKDMCPALWCDPATHTCGVCGRFRGDSCCPPDPIYPFASCRGGFWEDQQLGCRFGDATMSTGRCIPCGRVNQEACLTTCDIGLVVNAGGTCVPCGKKGNPSCHGSCDAKLRNVHGVCIPCGGCMQPPCASTQCDPGQVVLHNLDPTIGTCTCAQGFSSKPPGMTTDGTPSPPGGGSGSPDNTQCATAGEDCTRGKKCCGTMICTGDSNPLHAIMTCQQQH